ncbi:hypothetical protein SNEBB_009080 [Seison nebaliae]|nr:hypothetical protein SNEBB_009080 [Seison nebaliae]
MGEKNSKPDKNPYGYNPNIPVQPPQAQYMPQPNQSGFNYQPNYDRYIPPNLPNYNPGIPGSQIGRPISPPLQRPISPPMRPISPIMRPISPIRPISPTCPYAQQQQPAIPPQPNPYMYQGQGGYPPNQTIGFGGYQQQ